VPRATREILGLRIENVLDNCTCLSIIEKLWKSEQQDFLKTTNGKRYVELHSSIAALLREHIGQRNRSLWVNLWVRIFRLAALETMISGQTSQSSLHQLLATLN